MASRRQPLYCCSGRLCWLARRRRRQATPRNQLRRPRSCRCSVASRPSDSTGAAAAQLAWGGEEMACLRCLRMARRVSRMPAAAAVALEAWSARGAPLLAESYGQLTTRHSPRAETAAAASLRGWCPSRSPRRLQSACDSPPLHQTVSRGRRQLTGLCWSSAPRFSAKLLGRVGTHR